MNMSWESNSIWWDEWLKMPWIIEWRIFFMPGNFRNKQKMWKLCINKRDKSKKERYKSTGLKYSYKTSKSRRAYFFKTKVERW